jgi:Tfp pilus assembly protein PilO
MIPSLGDALRLLRRRRWITISLVGGLLVLGVLWTVVIPRARSAYQSYHTWQEKQNRIQAARSWKTQLAQLRREQKQLRQRLDSLFVSFPRGDQMSVVLEVLQTQARRTGIVLRQLQPDAKQTFETYEVLPLDVSLSGRYHAIGRFVDLIEQSKYLMQVEQINMQTEDMVTDTLQTQLRLSLVTLREQGGEVARSSSVQNEEHLGRTSSSE